MDSAIALLAVAAMGVNFGWEPVDEGPPGYEYVVQLEPELVDVLRDGGSVPIESYVPAEAMPIRKVRIVVGRDELPRSAGTAAEGDTVVRGQDDAVPQSYTARWADDPSMSSWSTDGRYNDSTASDWPTMTAPSLASPWRESAREDSRVAMASGQQTSSGWTSIRPTVAAPPLLNPSLRPPTGAATTAASPSTQKSGERYQPGPLDDRYETTPAGSDWARAATATSDTPAPRSGGLVLPDPTPDNRTLQPSPLFVPSITTDQGAREESSWAGNAEPAASSRNNVRNPQPSIVIPQSSLVDLGTTDSSLVPVQPPSSHRQSQPQEQDRYADPWSGSSSSTDWSWADDSRPATSSQATSNRTVTSNLDSSRATTRSLGSSTTTSLGSDWSTTRPTQSAASTDSWGDPRTTAGPSPTVSGNWPSSAPSAPPLTENAARQPVAASPASGTAGRTNAAVPGASPPTIASGPAPQVVSQEQLPWLPLLLVSLGLAGSLGANLFLGWSYVDARQRYRSLVQKTTDAFHRRTPGSAGRGAAA